MSHGYDRLVAYEAGVNSSRSNHLVDGCLLDSPGAERYVISKHLFVCKMTKDNFGE